MSPQGSARARSRPTRTGSLASSAKRRCSRRSIIRTSRRSTASRSRLVCARSSWSWSRADARGSHRARADSGRRGAADRPADRRSARGGARAGHHPSRSQAREHQDRADGTVKVLDFGSAKAMRAAVRVIRRARSHSPTITTRPADSGGVILGTAAYMSPEQARGQGGRQARRHLGVRVRALRDADGHAGFSWRDVTDTRGRHHQRARLDRAPC